MENEFLTSPVFWVLVLAIAYVIGEYRDKSERDSERDNEMD